MSGPRLCTICGNPVPTASRGQTCSYSCRAKLREARKTSEWRKPRQYPEEVVENVRHLYEDRGMTRAEVQATIGRGVKAEVIIRNLGIARRAIKRDQRREKNDSWAGDAITYTSAHDRVRAVKGAASIHLCIDCSSRAEDWSYTGDGGDRERVDPESGCRYSLSIENYVPRCKSCHCATDRTRNSVGQFTGRETGANVH